MKRNIQAVRAYDTVTASDLTFLHIATTPLIDSYQPSYIHFL